MKSIFLALAVFGSLATVAAYSGDCTSWYDWFDKCTDTCRPLCEEPPKHHKTTTPKPTFPTTIKKTTAPVTEVVTDKVTTEATSVTTEGIEYSTVSQGYTPSPGQCVCVSEGSSPSFESSTGGSSTPGFSEGSSIFSEASTGAFESSSAAYLVSSTGSEIGSTSGHCDGCGSTCILIEVFYNFTILFEGEIQLIWIEFVEHCDKYIFSVEWYTAEEKFIKCVYALKALFAEYEEIRITLQYQWIVEWGYVIDLFTVAVNVQYEYINATIEIDSEGSCPLFDALLNYTQGNSEQHDACISLIDELTIIIESSYYSYFDKLYLIYVKFEAFFSVHSSWEAEFWTIEIEGFGTLEQFISVTYVFEQISTVDVAIGGSTSECELITVLTECSQNTSFSISIRSEIKQFVEKLTVYFEAEVDVYLRLEYFVDQSFQLYVLEDYIIEYIYGLQIGSWGTLYQLIAAGYFHHHCGWGSHITTLAPTTTPELTTTPEPTTTTSTTTTTTTTTTPTTTTTTTPTTTTTTTPTTTTTTKPTTTKMITTTTKKPTTTTPKQGVCSKRAPLIVINKTSNTTIFTTSLNKAVKTWSASYQTQFKGYKKRVEVLIWGKMSSVNKISNISLVLGHYAKDARETTLKKVKLGTWGTIAQWCKCDGY